jgi:flagellum-specific ATP synthase
MTSKIKNWTKEINKIDKFLKHFPKIINYGILVHVKGFLLKVQGLILPLGSICYIDIFFKDKIYEIQAEVIGFKKNILYLIALNKIFGLYSGAKVYCKGYNRKEYNNFSIQVPLGEALLGRVLDGIGNPLDGKVLKKIKYFNLFNEHYINPMDRVKISKIFDIGIRSINSLLTIGIGQRVGIFSSAGLGKSFLLCMIAKYSCSEIIVIGLIGERGREIKEFIENFLGENILLKSVVIAVPADVSPLLKIKGVNYAIRIAEYFRDLNYNVLLIIDSLTRYQFSLREIGLSSGEFPSINGHPSSVFSNIQILLERIRNNLNDQKGSITAFFTILTELNDESDFFSDFFKSVLDGHIILSKNLFNQGIYPAIDISTSISRIMPNITCSSHYKLSVYFKKLFFSLMHNQDLINVGAYHKGSNIVLDKAIKIEKKLTNFLKQDLNNFCSFESSIKILKKILK